MPEEVLKGLLTSGPLALVLGVAVWTLWGRLQRRDDDLIKCKDDCAAQQAAQAAAHKEEIKELHREQLDLLKGINGTLKSLMEDGNGQG